MSKINVQRIGEQNERTLPVFAEMESLLEQIRERAYALARSRGFASERALDDWLQAEHDLGLANAELSEDAVSFLLTVALPGFEPADVELTATPGELIVHARAERQLPVEGERRTCFSEFRNETWRRVELPGGIDVEQVRATLRDGMLRVVAPKTAALRVVPEGHQAAA